MEWECKKRPEKIPIGNKFKIINCAFEEAKNKFLNQYNITAAQFDILLFLRMNPKKEIHQREIEKWLRLKNPTVTGILNRLEEKQFIIRRTNDADKRFRMIDLTEKGTMVLKDVYVEMKRMEAELFSCLTEQELQQLCGMLDKIIEQRILRADRPTRED